MALHGVVRKLRGRTPAELRDRATQRAAAWLERLSPLGSGRSVTAGDAAGVLAAAAPRDFAALLAAHRARRGRAFFPAFADPRATVEALRRFLPHEEDEVLARAERVHRGRFDLLGHVGLDFGQPVDWHLEPLAGRRSPLVHWSRIPYLDTRVVGDHKVVWELNRHQYLAVLGQAYWYTGNERHAQLFAAHVSSWLDENPPKVGINWASSLEVAFRAMSWLWALHLFADSPSLRPELYVRMLAALCVHGQHLERYLSTYFSPNTHLTGEALGLFHLGVLLPDLAAAPRWRDLGLRVLTQQFQRQVHPDGVYFEQATQYHRYTTEFYLHLLLLAERNGISLPAALPAGVSALVEHLLHLSRGDGTMPLFGDDDGGRLVQLDGRSPADVRGVLALGAVLFDRADFAFGARGDHALAGWMLGSPGLAKLSTTARTAPTERSRAFPHGGYFVSRAGWDASDPHLVLDCGPHGAMNCGHAHDDALSLELWAGGRGLVVDPGTFTYSGRDRDAFRSGLSHNRASVWNRPASEVGRSAFAWSSVARASLRRWQPGNCCDLFAGELSGWSTAAAPVVHWRQVLFVRDGYLMVRDRLRASAPGGTPLLDVVLRFQLGIGLIAEVDGGRRAHIRDGRDGEPVLAVEVVSGATVKVEEGWVSPRYGVRCTAPRLTCHAPAGSSPEITTFLLLPSSREATTEVDPVACVGGRAFRVSAVPESDVIVIRDHESAMARTTCGIETDAALTWIRRLPRGRVAVSAWDLTQLRVDDRTIHESTERAESFERGC